MKESYTKVFKESRIIVKRLQSILESNDIYSRIKSDIVPGYEITNYIDELYILKTDLEKAQPLIDTYIKEINL